MRKTSARRAFTPALDLPYRTGAGFRDATLTNTIALYLGAALALAIGADILINDGVGLMFLVRKFLDLVEWVVFWR